MANMAKETRGRKRAPLTEVRQAVARLEQKRAGYRARSSGQYSKVAPKLYALYGAGVSAIAARLADGRLGLISTEPLTDERVNAIANEVWGCAPSSDDLLRAFGDAYIKARTPKPEGRENG